MLSLGKKHLVLFFSVTHFISSLLFRSVLAINHMSDLLTFQEG